MNTVAKVDISVARFSVHYFCSLGSKSVISVAGPIVAATVSLGFCDDTRSKISIKKCAETFPYQLTAYINYIGV